MKKIILLFVLNFAVVILFAQQVISNGEDTGLGWWTAGSAGAVDVWDNPLKDAVNSSNKAMTVWINNDNVDYTGGGMGGLSINVTTYNTISVMVFKQIAGNVRLELQDGTANYFVSANYTTPGAWQKLNFPIPAMGNIITLLVAPHNVNYSENPIPDGEAHRMWWDEVVAFNETTMGVSSAFIYTEIIKTEIFTMTGNLVKTINGNQIIPYSSMLKGIYILKQTDVKGNTVSSKISIK